jgi:hypothetical protein
VKDSVVKSIYWAEVAARKQGITLTKSPYRLFLIKAGGEKINTEITKEVAIIGRGGPRIEANALIKMMNKTKMKGKEKIKIME